MRNRQLKAAYSVQMGTGGELLFEREGHSRSRTGYMQTFRKSRYVEVKSGWGRSNKIEGFQRFLT